MIRIPPGFDDLQFEICNGPIPMKNERVHSHIPTEIYYVDGACKGNGKPDFKASWALVAEFDLGVAYSGLVLRTPTEN